MHWNGYVVQWNNEKQRGMIHLGGRGHSALLGFAAAGCDAELKKQLRLADIPSAAAIPVQLGVGIRDGNVLAMPVSVARARRSVRPKSVRATKKRRRK